MCQMGNELFRLIGLFRLFGQFELLGLLRPLGLSTLFGLFKLLRLSRNLRVSRKLESKPLRKSVNNLNRIDGLSRRTSPKWRNSRNSLRCLTRRVATLAPLGPAMRPPLSPRRECLGLLSLLRLFRLFRQVAAYTVQKNTLFVIAKAISDERKGTSADTRTDGTRFLS